MTGLVRKATLFALGGLFVAGAAMANVPDPLQSTCPYPHIYIVGNDGTGPDRGNGQFTVTVIGLNGLPIENSVVVVDFAACIDIALCPDQLQPGVLTTATSVRQLTNVAGQAVFTVIGKGKPGVGCGSSTKTCVNIYADGVYLCSVGAGIYDLVNSAPRGVGSEDLAEWISLWLCGTMPTRADYIPDWTVDSSDLSKWITVWLAGNSSIGCTPKF